MDSQVKEIARAIYREVYGSIDNKLFKQDKIGEIEDWLLEKDTDLSYAEHDTFISLWREYDADDIEEMGIINI